MGDLVFGRDRDPQVVSALAGEKKKGSGALKANPMLALGPGPLGKKCGTCSHLFARGGVAGTYYKCSGRGGRSLPRPCCGGGRTPCGTIPPSDSLCMGD